MSQHVKSQNHVMSLQLSSIFFIFCPTGCFPPSDCKWPSLLCLILLCKQIAPVLATQNKIHRLSEVEAQLTELEDHLEDVHMTRVVQQVSVLRLQLRPIKAQPPSAAHHPNGASVKSIAQSFPPMESTSFG